MAESTTTFAAALLAGGLAGMAVDTAFFPIDTLKTRLQAQEGFVKAGGFSGVYRGLGSAVVGSAPGGELRLLLGEWRSRLDFRVVRRRC